jgi:hypothetical protein
MPREGAGALPLRRTSPLPPNGNMPPTVRQKECEGQRRAVRKGTGTCVTMPRRGRRE